MAGKNYISFAGYRAYAALQLHPDRPFLAGFGPGHWILLAAFSFEGAAAAIPLRQTQCEFFRFLKSVRWQAKADGRISLYGW